MHARGKTFEPGDKTLPPPLSIAYKKTGVLAGPHPLPHETRGFRPGRGSGLHRSRWPQHPEPRGQQVRAHQLGRGSRHHHRRDAPHQGDLRPHGHSLPERPARREQGGAWPPRLRAQTASPLRWLHPPGPQRRQLGRLVVGCQARVGLRVARSADAPEEPAVRHRQERRTAAVLGLRPGDHHLGLGRPAPQPPELLVDGAGHQTDLHRPRPQLRRRRPRRQVDPHIAQHRRGALSRHRPSVVHARHLRQGLPRDPRVRRGQVRGLRQRRGGRDTQVAGVGSAHHRHPRPGHQSAG